MIIRSLLCLVFFLSLHHSVKGQQYNFINYSNKDGLVQSQVRSICQDQEGYLWIGTLGGLSKFDGISFENFSVRDGLLNDNIYSITESENGHIYLGSKGGINVYTGRGFIEYRFKSDLKDHYVHSIVEDKYQNIWLGLMNGWVVRFKGGKFSYKQTGRGNIHHLFCDEDNNIWISADQGISIIDQSFSLRDTINGVKVSQASVYNDTLLYTSYREGVFIVSKGKEKRITTENGLVRNNIRGFTRGNAGDLWFYSKKGLIRYSGGKIKTFLTDQGLPNDNILCLIEDREGNLFAGTDGAGFIKYSGDKIVSYSVKDGLNNDAILSVVEDDSGALWFSTFGGGVSVIQNKIIKNYTLDDGLINNTVWSSFKCDNGDILFGTAYGISLFDGEQFRTFFEEKDNQVWSIYQDKTGNVWAGTISGLLYFDKMNNSIINYSEIEGINHNVKNILAYNDHQLWFCSDDGIYRYSYEEGTFRRFSKEDGLPDNFIMSVTKDKNGIIWVGTANGLAYYDGNRFKTVDFTNISRSNFITFLTVDDENNLWIGTSYGLFSLSIASYDEISINDFTFFSDLDGMKGLECNQNSVYIDSRDRLWFGTNERLIEFDLNKHLDNSIVPIVHLKGIRLFFEEIDLTNFSDSINIQTGLPINVTFKHSQDHLTFDYVGISHTNPKKVKYMFKLEGNDEFWSPLTSNTYVTYSNLDFGKYSFYLKASNDNVNWTEPLQVNFTISPPYYFTWWFVTLMFVLFGLLILAVLYWRKKVTEKKRRTQLIMDKSQILELEQQALNASMNRHFIFNALNSIQYYINREDKLSANKYLTSFAKLVRKNLDSSLVNEIILNEEIERIRLYLQLEQMRFQDKFSYELSIDETIDLQAIKIPPMLLQPFVENSIIHGILPMDKPGEIKVDIKKKGRTLIIKILDNGLGIDESLKIKQRKKKLKEGDDHISQGTALIKGRIKLVNKLSEKKCFVDGPRQIYDEDRKTAGTLVTIRVDF